MTQIPHVRGNFSRKVVAFVAANPGATSPEVAEGINRSAENTSAKLSKLHQSGILTRQRRGKPFCYMIAEAPPCAPTADLFTASAIARLEARIAELEAWKADAVAKHPDLEPVDPLLLQARQIVARISVDKGVDEETVKDILLGEYDNLSTVRAALAALRSVAP